MNELALSLEKAATEFVIKETYDWRKEFVKRRMLGGTRMPLTYLCKELEVKFYMRPGRERYADKELVIRAKFTLTELGKKKMVFLKEHHDMERTTVGTIAFWLFRRNERKRQSLNIRERSKHVDWQTLKNEYVKYRERVIEQVYYYLLDEAINYLQKMLDTKNWKQFFDNCTRYIQDMGKKQVNMVGVGFNRFPYINVLEIGNPKRLIRNYIKLLKLIKLNFFSEYRLNPFFMLAALRNRPLDIEKINEISATGTMDRSREAIGQPPFSLLWMFIYDIKKVVLKECLNRIESIYGIVFYDPIRYSDFYYRFTQKQNGLYLFGDNGLLIENNEIVSMYDLSLSDVFQGWLRRQGKNNFCFFLRLDADYDCGSTGDAMTTLWNIEGQVFIWRVFRDGKLTTDKKWPEIKELSEATDTFLGHCWSDILKDWFTKGVRLTTDNAKQMIAFTYMRGRENVIRWNSKETVPANEFLALAISSGMLSDCKLTKFYEWVRERKDIFSEDGGVVEQIKTARDLPGFMDLTKDNLAELAKPYTLTNYEYAEE